MFEEGVFREKKNLRNQELLFFHFQTKFVVSIWHFLSIKIFLIFRIFIIAHKAAKKSGKKKEPRVIEYKEYKPEEVKDIQVNLF